MATARGTGARAMSWDALQHEVLEAMGHVVYTRAAPERPRLPDAPLVHALLRAAGRDADDAEANAVCQACLPIARLAGDPLAKRALWPRLRALRALRARCGP